MKSGDAANGRCSRASFLTQAGVVLLAATAGANVAFGQAAPTLRPTKGKANSKVKRWDVITVGNLSRNQYWGESSDHAVRNVLCTCTLIRGDGFRLLVDPSETDEADMARELDRRTGLKLKDITAVFVTHEHQDHWCGLHNFPEARWTASPGTAEILNQTAKLARPVESVTGRLFDAVDILPTPGHTPSHHSLRFDCDGFSVVAAGDATATRDFFRDRRNFYNATDPKQGVATMNKLAELADLIIPGHDNYFVNS
ncbi:MAG: MBL fold metallo-hydrolase [Verrucomicrobiota bacterium]|jgi:glyoxylase-like metal-dependent hydrolase (beta-lactamase superfamily II)